MSFISKDPGTPYGFCKLLLQLYETLDRKITHSSVNYEFNKETINKSGLIYYDKGKQFPAYQSNEHEGHSDCKAFINRNFYNGVTYCHI